MLCLRARAAVVRWKVASNVVMSLFPFPYGVPAFPFPLKPIPSHFRLDVPTPNLLPNFNWLIDNHIMTIAYVYRFYSIFAMPHLVRHGLCPRPRQLVYVPPPFKIIVSVGTHQLTRVALHSHA